MAKATLRIGGMSCDHCVKAVTDTLIETNGVSKTKVNLKKGEAKVNFDDSVVSLKQLGQAVADAGYEFVSAK
jgi:copper ion binding protein